MKRRSLLFLLVLLSSLPLEAQTDAQRALAAEPEVRQINAMTRDLQRVQNDPDLRGSPLNMAGLSLADLRTAQALLDRLEGRLDGEARSCAFCAAKQDELSELMRERIAIQEMTASILGPGSGSVQQLVGVTPTLSRWSDIRIALEDGSSAMSAYCPPLKNQDEACRGDNAAMRLAGGHENAWAKCFNSHNWVERSSERRAYESCMADADPIATLCATARKASPQAPACPTFRVAFSDVSELHFYHDRFSTDPERLPATARIITNQPAHFTTLEALVAPAMPTFAGFKMKIRARLDTPIEGEYAPGLNPSTTNVSSLDAKAGAGLGGRVILIPAGTEFQIDVIFTGPNAQRGDGGYLNLQVVNLHAGSDMLSTQNLARKIPWPQEGTVLLPANSPVSLATQCGCPYPMSVAEFRKKAGDYTAAKGASPANNYRAIVQGTRVPIVLLEPIDNAGVLDGKRFRAELSADSELSASVKRDDALTVPKGTEAYLKVTDVNDHPLTGQYAARLRIDYLMLNGQKIVMNTVGENLDVEVRLTPPPANRRGGPAPSGVIEPTGTHKMFTVAAQSEVNTNGMTLPSAIAAPASTPAASSAAPASRGATKGAAAPTPAAPTAARGAAATDVRSIADYSASWMGRNVTATGTVARVEASGPWELLHFKESSDFVACFAAAVFRAPTSPVMQAGGVDFAGLVGKSVQVKGPVAQSLCAGKAGLRITTPSQIQVAR